MFRRCIPSLLALALCLGIVMVLPAGALANDYTEVERAYSQSTTASVPPCEFSGAVLTEALKQAPAYDYQYGADISDAIQAALSARAGGACQSKAKAKTKAAAGSPGSGATLRSAGTQLPSSVDSSGSGGLPLVLVVAFALAGACLLVLGGWIAFGALGYDPGFGRAARHSLREAEYRIGAGWDDLTDRLRR